MIQSTIQAWHNMLDSNDMSKLDDLLADDAVFHSPVVHTPQAGKDLVKLYLMAASTVFLDGKFTYVREVMSGNDAVLEFQTELDGIHINGVDMIRCDDSGKIVDFKVMIRPLKAVNLLHAKMKAMLEQLAGGQAKS